MSISITLRAARAVYGVRYRNLARLCACAFVREVWPIAPCVTEAERADGHLHRVRGIRLMREQICISLVGVSEGWRWEPDERRLRAVQHLLAPGDAYRAATECAAWCGVAGGSAERQIDIVRDVFGPDVPAPVVPLHAAVMVEEADCLPILADALEDAGCDSVALLSHLRGPGPHVFGCWALRLLRKEVHDK